MEITELMSIDTWASNQEIVGNFLTFPKMGSKILKFVFLDDGKEGTKFPGSDRIPVEFSVEAKGKQWKFNTSSRRLLNEFRSIAATNNNSLIGIPVRVERTGEMKDTKYAVEIIVDFKSAADDEQASKEPVEPTEPIE